MSITNSLFGAGSNPISDAFLRNYIRYYNSPEGLKVRGYTYAPVRAEFRGTGGGGGQNFTLWGWVKEGEEPIPTGKTPEELYAEYMAKNPYKGDASENFLNNLMAGGAGLWRAAATGVLGETAKTASNTLLYWLPKLSFLSAYGATPAAMWGDMLMMAVPTGFAINDIYNNGLNWLNGTEVALGMLPIAGEAYNGIKTMSNGLRSFSTRFTPQGIRIGSNIYGVDLNSMAMGFPKMLVTPAEQWQLQSLPGMQIKSLIKGSPLEKLLSKNGTISVKLLQAYIGRNDVPTHDKYLIQLVLDNHAGETHLDYNTLRSEVQGMIPVYNRVPQTQYDSYGIKSLGIDVSPRGAADKLFASEYNGRELVSRRRRWPGDPIGGEVVPGEQVREEALAYMKEHPTEFTQLKTFTFESPGIKGNQKHYKSGEPLGHSRTYISKDEPDVLHVMESQSDWAQAGGISPDTPKREMILNEINKVKQDLDSENFMFKSRQELEWELEDLEKLMQEYYGQASSPIQDRMIKSYTQRLIQENLKHAAENGLTKMRYPTSETAAKIEGYSKTELTPEYKDVSDELDGLIAAKKNGIAHEININTGELIYYSPELLDLKIRELENKVAEFEISGRDRLYPSAHQTILKKYSDFPKQYEKLFGKGTVREITDAKGNTWYEVNVPESYRNGTMEMIFKTGGRLKLIPKSKL